MNLLNAVKRVLVAAVFWVTALGTAGAQAIDRPDLVNLVSSVNSANLLNQASPTLSLTLDEAIRRGLETSHRIDEARARVDAAEAAADQRLAASRPLVAAQAGYMRTNHVEAFGVVRPNNEFQVIYPDIPDNYRTRLDAQWPIYDGKRRYWLERAARSEAVVAGRDVEIARQDLRLEITRAYWALVTAIESRRVVDESLVRVEAHVRDVENQLDAGLIPQNDVLTVEAQRSRQRMLSIQARVLRDVAEAELGRLVGAVPGTAIQPQSILDTPPPSDVTIESLVQAARQNRDERGGLLERVLASEEREKAAAAGAKPTVAVTGGVDYANPNARIFPRQDAWRHSWDASVNVNWPVFDGGRARAEIAEAAAVTRAARARLAEFDAVLEVEVRQRLSEVAASRAAIAAAADGVGAATEARRVAGERFLAGVATTTDVVDAQVAVLQAGLDRTQAIANLRLAEARLARSIGAR